MYTQLELDKIYPGMWDITLQETSDIKHDYYMMLDTFGPDDADVIKYKKELDKRVNF